MPFSILIQGYPRTDISVDYVQGSALQGMFLHLIQDVDPAVSERLHNDDRYRPYTLSPLGIGETPGNYYQSFRLPRDGILERETRCYFRLTLLEDELFSIVHGYFLEKGKLALRLGETEFMVTDVVDNTDGTHPSPLPGGEAQWSQYLSYPELINRTPHRNRRISLRFLTPTSFRRGRIDFPLPDPRLVFRSYRKRFEEFYQVAFLPDFEEQVEYHTGISNLKHLETRLFKARKVSLLGFTGRITYAIDRRAAPDLIFQMNLLADFAFFCGTGKKTTIGMGQTVRSA